MMTKRTDKHCNPYAPKPTHPPVVRERIGESLKDAYAKGRRFRHVGFKRESDS